EPTEALGRGDRGVRENGGGDGGGHARVLVGRHVSANARTAPWTPQAPAYGCPAPASGVNPRLPRRATRTGGRGAQALARHSPPPLPTCEVSRGDEGAFRGRSRRKWVAR